MTATTDQPHTDSTTATTARPNIVNARGEQVFLRAEGYELTARELTLALAAHLTHFGDTLHVRVVDPLCAIDAHMRFDGDLHDWAIGRTPADVAVVLARAEHIARDYFGHQFPTLTW